MNAWLGPLSFCDSAKHLGIIYLSWNSVFPCWDPPTLFFFLLVNWSYVETIGLDLVQWSELSCMLEFGREQTLLTPVTAMLDMLAP